MSKQVFTARKVEMTDGSEFYEVVTPLGERIISFDNEEDADTFETAMNELCRDADHFFNGVAVNWREE